MKILSLEKSKSGGKNILIPCYLYEIVVDETYGGNNILEEVVAKIIKIEPHYKTDINKLAEILGLKDSGDMDYHSLLKLVLSKIKNPQTQEARKEIKQYQIYQERISGEVLGIITQNVDRFIESSGGNKDKIKFEKNGKELTAANIQPNKEISTPTLEQIFKAIATHNRNGDFTISENLDLKLPKNREAIYLHCQVILGEGRKFSVTNGFNSAFSLQLESILKDGDLLKKLRAQNYTDEKKESAYKQIYNDFRDGIIYNLQEFNDRKDKHQYLYNAYEQYFAYLVEKNNYSIPSHLNEAKFIKERAEEMDFEVNEMGLGLFTNNNYENLKSYLARLLLNNDKTLNKFAEKNPNFLKLLSVLHNDRNVALHGGDKKKNYKEMDIKELSILKELLESIINVNVEKGEETNSNNGIVLLEKELPKNIINALSDESLESLAKAREAKDKKALSLDTFSDITQGLYKACESVLLKYIQIHKACVKKADIEKIRKMPWLDKVEDRHIENATKGQNATLGAYTIIYLSINKDEYLSYIKRLLELRAHANPTIADLQKTSIDELIGLYTNIIDFIIKIINHT